MRINGAQKVLERMAKSMSIDLNDKKIVFSVSKDPVDYQGLKLYKITL